MKKELMIKAHKMTREIKAEYPEVNYKFQLGLCISYLLKNEVKEDDTMVELNGTEKQVAWANDIRENIIKMFDEKIELMNGEEKSYAIKNELIRNRQYFKNKVKTTQEARQEYVSIIKEVKEAILNKDQARWFISFKNNDVEDFVSNYFYAVNKQCGMFLERFVGRK